jgi:hypothetical protein
MKTIPERGHAHQIRYPLRYFFSYDNKTALQQVFLNFDYTDKA